jgi:DNA-binding response OmpR family regulator
MRLLIVDDHQPLVASLFSYFEPRGMQLDAAPDGVVGLHLATTQAFDAVVLDWMLPRLDGPSMLQRLRERGIATPVLMLTARDQLPDKLIGFRSGADDYLTKPFDLAELEARLLALVMRSQGRVAARCLKVADLELDLATLEARRAGQMLHLFPASMRILQELMLASPAAVSRAHLEQVLWGEDPPDGDMLRSHIYELRRAVDGKHSMKLIQTLPRVGYRMCTNADNQTS